MTGLRLGLLGLATFVYVTFELLPVGLIGDIAADLDVSQGRVGLLVSGYAVVAGIVTIPSVRLVARWPRARALQLSLAVLVVAGVIASVATTYPVMVLSRVLAAATHGILWSLVAPVAATLVPRHRAGMATAVVFGGATAASVVGSPLATLVGEQAGWRVAAAGLAALAALVLGGLVLVLPVEHRGRPAAPVPQIDARSPRPLGPHQSALVTIFGLAVIVVSAHFVSFTYIAPIARDALGEGADVPALLVVFGAAGAVAAVLAGRGLDAAPVRTTVAAVAAMAVGTGGLALAVLLSGRSVPIGAVAVVMVVAMAVWGGAVAVVGPSFQAGVMRLAGDRVDTASAVYVTCYQVGIAAGSATGAVLVGSGVILLPVLSAVACVIALAVTIGRRRIYAPSVASAPAGSPAPPA